MSSVGVPSLTPETDSVIRTELSARKTEEEEELRVSSSSVLSQRGRSVRTSGTATEMDDMSPLSSSCSEDRRSCRVYEPATRGRPRRCPVCDPDVAETAK